MHTFAQVSAKQFDVFQRLVGISVLLNQVIATSDSHTYSMVTHIYIIRIKHIMVRRLLLASLGLFVYNEHVLSDSVVGVWSPHGPSEYLCSPARIPLCS